MATGNVTECAATASNPTSPSLLTKILNDAPNTCDDNEQLIDVALIKNWAKLSMEAMPDRLQRYTDYLSPSIERLKRSSESFKNEIILGLSLSSSVSYPRSPSSINTPSSPPPFIKQCSLSFMDSHIKAVPDGSEEGDYYALVVDQTDCHVAHMQLKPGSDSVSSKKIHIFKDKFETDEEDNNKIHSESYINSRKNTTLTIFDMFSETCKNLMIAIGDPHEDDEGAQLRTKEGCVIVHDSILALSSLHTLSETCINNPFNHMDLQNNSAKKNQMTSKYHSYGYIETINRLMSKALQDYRIPLNILPIPITTTTDMLLGHYLCCSCPFSKICPQHDAPCLVSILLDTNGIYASYYDEELPQKYGYTGKIVSLICANYNRDLPFTVIDNELDFADTAYRGYRRLNKMVAEAYLGELSRTTIVKVLRHTAPQAAWTKNSLPCECIMAISQDVSDDLSKTASILKALWKADFKDVAELAAIQQICTIILERSAALASVVITGIVKKLLSSSYNKLDAQKKRLTVLIDGPLYRNSPHYQKRVTSYTKLILGSEIREDFLHICSPIDPKANEYIIGKGGVKLTAMLKKTTT